LLDAALCLPARPIDDDRHGPLELREGRPASRGRFKERTMVAAHHQHALMGLVFSASALLHTALLLAKA
jgi:hypothetical protein